MSKKLLSLLLVIVLALGWVFTVTMFFDDGEEKITEEEIDMIAYYREIGEEQRNLGAYGKAVECYENIITINPSLENYLELCDVYYEAGRTNMYSETLQTVINVFPDKTRPYELLGQYYLDTMAFTECKDTTGAALEKGVKSKLIEDLYYESAYTHDTHICNLESASRYYNGYSVVNKEAGFYYVDTSIQASWGPYEYATSFTDVLAAVLGSANTYYYINLEGEKYLSTTGNHKIAYSFCEGFAIVETKDGKYKYLSTDNKLQGGEFEYATLYKNGVAGVKHGGKWYLIDTTGVQIEGTKAYADILYDEDNICSNSGVVFVSDGKDKGYYMVNLKGEKIGKDTYEDAKPFFDSSITAVKKGGKWGFVDTNGKLIIDYQYEDAQPFGYDTGAVKVDGKWGFVAANNRMVIEPKYEDAKSFSADKICPVMIDGKWGYLQIIA